METMIEIEKNDGNVEFMGIDEFSRWMCLAEAFHYINLTSKTKKKSGRLKPLAIHEYINARFPAMKHDLQCELTTTVNFFD